MLEWEQGKSRIMKFDNALGKKTFEWQEISVGLSTVGHRLAFFMFSVCNGSEEPPPPQ